MSAARNLVLMFVKINGYRCKWAKGKTLFFDGGHIESKRKFFFNLLVLCLRNLISGENDFNLGLFVIIF